jgi:predicted nuclease of predicted toxin-antitoxin system
MKFLIDAQLPRLLAEWLSEKGYDAVHTLDLPQLNATDDQVINRVSIPEKRIIVSKDIDFYNDFLIRKQPYKLLLVTTGNIKNSQLLNLFRTNIALLVDLLNQHSVVELNRKNILVLS